MGKVINTTSDNLKKYKADQIRKMRYLVVDTVTDIEIEATRKAPVGEDGDHFITIKSEFRNNDLTGEVGVWGENNLAAYFEFGTGLSAREILAPYPEWLLGIEWKSYDFRDAFYYKLPIHGREIWSPKTTSMVKERLGVAVQKLGIVTGKQIGRAHV